MRGNITRRGPDTWRIRIELDRAARKRNRRSVTVRGTRRDAQKELARLLVAADAGMLPADPAQMSVGQYVAASLDSRLDLAPKTLERYRELAQRQIAPHIGGIKLQKLRPEHVEAWHAALLKTGLSPRTAINAHKLLSSVLERGITNGALARNVAAIRKPPAAEASEIEILTPEQITAVLDALKGHTLHPVVSLALATGMRRGELLALQWPDIDLSAATLRVERSLEETKAGLRIKPPKTKRGRRNLTLAPDAVAMLREHKIEQMELRLALGQGGQPTLVFSTIEGEHLKPSSVSRNWRALCEAKKLPRVQFHSLRHTHVSMLIRAGVDILTISRRIGHAQAAVTLDIYGHLIEGADAAAARAIDGILK
jgi:integrase